MYQVYALKSQKDGRLYIGISFDPNRRLLEHNAGYQKSTKAYRPYQMFLIENYPDSKVARQREKFLKSGCGREYLKDLYCATRK